MSIAALTTAFVPSSFCLASDNIWKVFTTCPSNDQCYYLLQGPPSTLDCLPTAYRIDSTAYYSPAHCPSGYTPACSSLNTVNQFTETVYTCCPTVHSFYCLTSKQLNFWPFQSSFGCASQFIGTGTLQVTASDRFSTSLALETYDKDGGINAFAIQVRFQSTDFVSTTSSPGPTSTPATPAQTVPSTTLASSPLPTSTPSGGLSPGAKAGIGVGVSVGVLALIAMLWFGYIWRKRRSQQATQLVQEHPEATQIEQPYPVGNQYENQSHARGMEGQAAASELDGQPRHLYEMR